MGNRIFSTGTLSARVGLPAGSDGNPQVGVGVAGTIPLPGGQGDNSGSQGAIQILDHTGTRIAFIGGPVVNDVVYTLPGGWLVSFTGNDATVTATITAPVGTPLASYSCFIAPGGGTVTSDRTGPFDVVASPGGVTATPFVNLQAISFELMAQVKDLFQPVQLGRFPVARVYYGIHLIGKPKIATVSASALATLLGTSFTGATPNIGTQSKTIQLPAFEGLFTTTDVNGTPIQIQCPNVTCPGITLPFALSDFVMPDFSFNALPDPITKIVATVQIG